MEPVRDITTPIHSPEQDTPTDTQHGLEQAAATVRATLPVAQETTYKHVPQEDGSVKYVDTTTGEMLDAIPRDHPTH